MHLGLYSQSSAVLKRLYLLKQPSADSTFNKSLDSLRMGAKDSLSIRGRDSLGLKIADSLKLSPVKINKTDSIKVKQLLKQDLKQLSKQDFKQDFKQGSNATGLNYYLEVVALDYPDLIRNFAYQKVAHSKKELASALRNVFSILYDNGYIGASLDSSRMDSLKELAFIHIGTSYRWAKLTPGNAEEDMLSEIGFREKLFFHSTFNYKQVKQLLEKIIDYYENNGYPFAEARIDSIHFDKDVNKKTHSESLLYGQLAIKKNKLITIDSVIIRGTATINLVYIESYLGIFRGSTYDESKIRSIGTKLKEVPFLKEKRPARVLFNEKDTKLILDLEKKKASQFDGIVGFLPDPITGKLTFTGNVQLKLQNVFFNHGEGLDIIWRSLKPQTQDLSITPSYPFIYSTPFGLIDDFKIYKQDTTYINVYNSIGLQYLLTGGNYIKIDFSVQKCSLLSTSGLEAITVLPDYADVSSELYGLGLKLEKLDYKYNPSKGYSLIVNVGVGTKHIVENANVNPLVYQNLHLNALEYKGDITAAYYLRLKGKSVIKFGCQSAFIASSDLFEDELFRIGGLNSLRGFDELSILASTYVIGTLEYRYILEQNSYMHLFFDQAYYENNSVGTYIHDTPFGFGAGISFETKPGIFSLDYALGSQFGNPIYLKAGKIHFGIVNYF